MNILVTNDDGILAPGLALLADVCRAVGTVTVVAPDREQSGTSHSLTLHRPLRPTRRPDGAWQVDGTPTDCVMLAIQALMPERPDFVFSGVNHGPNMGEDVLYSGTVSAAMEAVTLGVQVTKLGSRYFSDSLTRMKDPWGREIFWIGGGHASWTGEEDSDFRAIEDGFISVTPLHLDLTHYNVLEDPAKWWRDL